MSVNSSIKKSGEIPVNNSIKKSGTLWSALAHIITGVIGSGVLSLAWSMSRLGWIAGPLTMLSFALVTYISAALQANCYRTPDPELGPNTNPSYADAAGTILGKWNGRICGFLLSVAYIESGIVYTVTAGYSITAILKSNCYHYQGHEAMCHYRTSTSIALFGAVQILVSQIPKLRNTEWLSAVAAIMSFTYAFIGSGLGLAKIIGCGEIKGTIGGVPAPTAAEKVLSVAQALGNIAFSFPFSGFLTEIQDTLRTPPSEVATMKKASVFAICITTFFYLCCGGFGYGAFGDSTPGNLLTGFGFYEPYWLIDFANACIVLHLVGGYQILSQPLFAAFERRIIKHFPESRFVHGNYNFKLPAMPKLQLNALRICFRSTYVVCVTAVALAFPYFIEIIGVAGAINFWPLVMYFPVEMYIVQKNIRPWTLKAILLRTYSVICFVVVIFAFFGSAKALIKARFG